MTVSVARWLVVSRPPVSMIFVGKADGLSADRGTGEFDARVSGSAIHALVSKKLTNCARYPDPARQSNQHPADEAPTERRFTA